VHKNQKGVQTNAALIVDSECGQELENMPPFLTSLNVRPAHTVYFRNLWKTGPHQQRNPSILLNNKQNTGKIRIQMGTVPIFDKHLTVLTVSKSKSNN